MASTTFVNGTTTIVASWLNDVNTTTYTTVPALPTTMQNSTSVTLSSVAGTNTITGSLTPALTAYVAGQTFRFTAAGDNTGPATININGLGAKAITKSGTTALTLGDIVSGAVVQVTYDGTNFQLSSGVSLPDASETVKGIVELATIAEVQAGTDTVRAVTPAGLLSASGRTMQSIDYTLAGNALTLKLNPTTLAFRATTLTSGAPTLVSNAAQITTTISSGSTGGTISGQSSDIILLAINNAGTMELAWCNSAGGINLDETTLINTTAEGGAGAADSATVIYSTTARTGVAFRVAGLFRSTQTIAGTWAQTPSLVQPVGGQALAAMSSLGYGQTPQNVTGFRVSGTTYYNTTGKPISAYVYSGLAASGSVAAYLNGNLVMQQTTGAGQIMAVALPVIPAGANYTFTSSATITGWWETR